MNQQLTHPEPASAMTGPTGNTLHFVGAIVAALAMLQSKEISS